MDIGECKDLERGGKGKWKNGEITILQLRT